jgi:hypothetical protein
MSDEDPSASSPDSPSIPKKETVRITLPPKAGEPAPTVKRETVRINTPGPKKETTNIGGQAPLPPPSSSLPPPSSATRPLVPPPSPPRPPSAPGLPPMGARPGMPPPSAPKPAVPPPSAPKPAAPAAAPVTIKAAPKKETARIQVAPTSKLPPQATVRLTQPGSQLAAGPAPSIRTAAPAAAADTNAEPDMITTILMWAAVGLSLIAAVFSYLAWAAVS